MPLRSCKIKMKIQSLSSPSSDSASVYVPEDSFLVNSNEIVRFESLDKNRTLTVQTVVSAAMDSNDIILEQSEIKSFFKSLLSYVPIGGVARVEDLAKANESCIGDSSTVQCLKLVHQVILDSKQFGVSLRALKERVNEKQPTLTMRQLRALLDLLLEHFLVLAVGVVERVYVTYEFRQHWVIESCKSLKGRGNGTAGGGRENEEENDGAEIEEETSVMAATQDEGLPKRVPISPTMFDELADANGDRAQMTKNFKPVCLVPRPWRYIDGLLNRPVLKKMLETILIYLKTYPHASLDQLSAHFCPVLQPVMTLELCEMLEKLKCVRKVMLSKEATCDLFSDFTNGSHEIDQQQNQAESVDLRGDEVFCYFLNQNSIFTFKKIFSN